MATTKRQKAFVVENPDEVVHVMPRRGTAVIYQGLVYGDRSTLQVPRGELGRVVGTYEEVDPHNLPDVAER